MTSDTETVFPAYLVRGDDPTVTGDALRDLVAGLVGDGDPTLVVEELSGDDYLPAAVVDAAQTPPFFGDRRVVVARDVGRFTTQEVAPVVGYLGDPLATTALVLVGGGGQLPRSLVDAVRRVGHVVEAGVPTGKGRATWVGERLRRAPVRLDAEASALVGTHLGDEVARLGSLLDTLVAAYGPGARIGVDEVAPLLGQAGGVAPWELTDAIDAANTSRALEHLHRLMEAGGRHPLVLMATLHTHYARILRLEGAAVSNERQNVFGYITPSAMVSGVHPV